MNEKILIPNKSNRSSNIELLRIICMILIIAHHCIGHGGAAYMDTNINRVLGLILIPGGKICFNAFLAISTWFLIDKSFKTERFLKVWFQALFYSVLFCFIAWIMGNPMTPKDWFSAFLPISGNSHGFAAAYLAFYLLVPFLKIITQQINQKQAKFIVVCLLFLEVGTQFIGYITMYTQPLSSELLLFILCFFIANYFKKYPCKLQKSKSLTFSIFIMCWLFVFISIYSYLISNQGNQIIEFLWNIVKDESSIINIIGGYSLFFFFNNLKMPTFQSINSIASHTFGILLMHDNNFFRNTLWSQIVLTTTWFYSPYFIILVFISTLMIFISGLLIDFIRVKMFERLILKSSYITKICEKGDVLINGSSE